MLVREANLDELDALLQVRRVVFIEGQAVPEEIEVDGLDEECRHVVAECDGEFAGTARLRSANGKAKAERVAVLDKFRGRSIGRALMDALERMAREDGYDELVLAAQTSVLEFYDRLGYTAEGEVFYEADIPHRMMKKPL